MELSLKSSHRKGGRLYANIDRLCYFSYNSGDMKILILAAGSGTLRRLRALVDRVGVCLVDATVVISTIPDLFFCVDGNNTCIVDTVSGHDVSEFDLVVFRAVAENDNVYYEEALAVALYCQKHGTAFIDECLSGGYLRARKLATMMKLWAEDIFVPTTLFGSAHAMAKNIDKVGLPAILKATDATHGKDNYKIDSVDEIATIISSWPKKRFLLQNFIPNDGDYRILVVSEEFNIEHRRAAAGRHVNNESAGGTSTPVDTMEGLETALVTARKSARVLGLGVAGVDIIISPDGTPYVIEVNRAPQITSDKEAIAWANGLKGLLGG